VVIIQDHFSGDLTNPGKAKAKSEVVCQYFTRDGARAYTYIPIIKGEEFLFSPFFEFFLDTFS
jgi:hypothetical protein